MSSPKPNVLVVLTSNTLGWYLVRLFCPFEFCTILPLCLLIEIASFTSSVVTLFKQPEFAHPFEVLGPHCEITVASHTGGEAPLDPSSITAFKDDEVSTKFLKEQERLWKNTRKLEDFVGKTDQFDAIFYVGGYGRECSHSFPHVALLNYSKTGSTARTDQARQLMYSVKQCSTSSNPKLPKPSSATFTPRTSSSPLCATAPPP